MVDCGLMMIGWIVKTSNYLDHTIYTTKVSSLKYLMSSLIVYSPDSPGLSRQLERGPNHSMVSRRRCVDGGGGGAVCAYSHKVNPRLPRLNQDL